MSEHIRIGDIAPRVHYVADGVQTVFTYPFPIFEPGDIEVLNDSVPANFGFVIIDAGESDGGAIHYAEAPAAGTRITLLRRLTIERVTDFQSNGVLRGQSEADILRGGTATILIVAEPEIRLAEILAGLRTAGEEPDVKRLNGGGIAITVAGNPKVLDYLGTQRIEPTLSNGNITILLTRPKVTTN